MRWLGKFWRWLRTPYGKDLQIRELIAAALDLGMDPRHAYECYEAHLPGDCILCGAFGDEQ